MCHGTSQLSCHNKVSLTRWLKQQKLIFTQFWRLEGQDQDSSQFASWWELLSDLQMATFSLCSHMVDREKEIPLVSLLVSTLILLDEDPTVMTSFNLHYLQKAPSPNIVTLEVRATTYECWGHTNIQSIIVNLILFFN